jgi:hypothetical protein
VEGAIGAEDKGHVTDAFAVRNCLGVQRDMDGCRVVMVLSFARKRQHYFLFWIFKGSQRT